MNKQPSRIGLYLVLIVFLVAGYFYLNNQVTTQSDYTIEALEAGGRRRESLRCGYLSEPGGSHRFCNSRNPG